MPADPKNRLDRMQSISQQARQNGSDPEAEDLSIPGVPFRPQDYDPDAPKPIDIKRETVRYAGITAADGALAATSASAFGVWVPVPLPLYNGMSVLMRTGNKTKVRLAVPEIDRPEELTALDKAQQISEVALKEYLDKQEVPPDDVMQKFREATQAATLAFIKWGVEMRHIRAPWVAMFAVDFRPWPFEDVEKPDPKRPETYVALADEFEDLFDWLVSQEGYNDALAESAKNS